MKNQNKNLNGILKVYPQLNILINNGYEVEFGYDIFNHLYVIAKNIDFECRVSNGAIYNYSVYSEYEIKELIEENNRILELVEKKILNEEEFEELEEMVYVENLENCGSSGKYIGCTLWSFTAHNRDFEIYTDFYFC